MDKFAALKAFSQVVEAGGFAAAAREMKLSRSQVNKLVIGLEDQLGVQLLNRTTRSVSATPAGKAFYERASTILDDLAEAEACLMDEQDEPQGELRINAPMSFGTMHLGRALADFMSLHPKIRIELTLSDRFVDPVVEGFDMTVRIAEPREAPSLIDHQIIEARRVICVSPEFLKQHGEPQSPRALSGMPCLHYGHLSSGNQWRLAGPEGDMLVKVQCIFSANNAEVLRDAAVKGLGVALLPTFIAGAELQEGRLVTILSDYKAPNIFITLLYPPNRHLSPRIRALVAFLYERFGDRPYWDLVE
ncbi:LysR family transcriptional regulator [Hyphococcus sp.]|jgi:DNA-binding transcriptional LysR family regulator|uniref:LysR family transcriptional regulator n=1 Tax=Hyphococcus sp. TaxID=2038636 RepID=UPI003D119120